jgi:uncharacterized protein YdeI (YjbR/CyaY-like superfamily)
MGQPDPRVDAYIAGSAAFAQPILHHLREAVQATCPEVEETLKWGAPSFVYRGKILCSMAAFKQHASFGFWQGARVVGAVAAKPGEGMGQFGRLARLADLPGKRELAGYIKQAMKLIDSGVTRTSTSKAGAKPPLVVPGDFAAALAGDRLAGKTFEAFTTSQRREYVEWITEAKREATRQRRLAQAIEWLAEGKSRNWKYRDG